MRGRSSTAWLALLGVACGDAPAGMAVPEWQVSETPIVAIGADGDARTEFHRIGGAVRLGSGGIAVADGGSNQVRYFAPDGRFLEAFGRQGEGPGEFQSMGRLIRFGDTLAVHDGRTDRLTIFLGDSLLDIRPIRVTNQVHRFSITHRLADGRWVAGTSISPRFAPAPYRDSIAVGVVPASADGAMLWLGWFPGPWVASVPGMATGPAGFYTWVHAAALGEHVVVLDGNQERLRRYSADGPEAPGGALGIEGEPLTAEILEQAKRQELDRPGGEAERQWVDAKYGPEVIGERLPAFRAMLSDDRGLVWLEGYRTDPSLPGRYFVFTGQAEPVATVPVPAGFRATDIGADYLLGVSTDADGVERVVMYRLTRGRT